MTKFEPQCSASIPVVTLVLINQVILRCITKAKEVTDVSEAEERQHFWFDHVTQGCMTEERLLH